MNIYPNANINAESFLNIALDTFKFQYRNNEVYGAYCRALNVRPGSVRLLTEIPFLPISFFKTHRVVCGNRPAELVFESSGTTGENTSRHFVTDAAVYEKALLDGFEEFYGPISDFAILALLPSYLERKNASLVHMAKTLMERSKHPLNGFYISEWRQLHDTIAGLEQDGQKTLLLGVTFALLDFAEAFPMHLRHTVVMETGGMKGRKREMTRDEVHRLLKQQLGVPRIHSEYGMTELLSQGYSAQDGIFRSTSTMQVLVRDINDPMEVCPEGQGCLNIVDLANINSCSFIATEDLGKVFADGSFEVLGRMDHSALRGCSLMAI